jgi:threonine dehydrogenase-like Zn-dependent dehydrogenase
VLQLSYRGRGNLAVEEVDPPALRPGEVRVRVHSVGVCKSDIYGYSGVNDRRDVVLGEGDVLVMGHEAVGHVEELGPGVAGPEPGTVVAVNPIFGCGTCALCRAGAENLCDRRTVHGCTPAAQGGFAETMAVPQGNVCPLADGTPVEWGALVEPLTVGAHGVRLAAIEPGASVLVIGGGIIGLGAALAARRRAGDDVLVLEPLPERRELCAQLGLRAAAPDEVLGTDRSFDVALDCVARPETFEGAIGAVPPQGRVVLVGIWEDYIPLPVSTVVWRETQILGSYGYNHADFQDVTEWVGRREVDLSPVIEQRVGFDGIIGAFETYADGSLNAVRTLLQPAL